MFSFQYPGPQKIFPLTTKIMMVVWIFIVLAILSFFTFSFFIIALLAGVVAFVSKLFQKNRTSISSNQPDFPKQHYRHNPKEKDNDIIDI
jgi:hypothetical protein